MMVLFTVALVIVASVRLLRDKSETGPWPWFSMELFMFVITAGAMGPLGSIDRVLGFITLTATLIIGPWWHEVGARRWLAAGLCVVVVSTFVLSGQRPFVPDNPNIVSGWFLLLPFGWWTVGGIAATQSLGAAVALTFSYVARFSVDVHRDRNWVTAARVMLVCCALLIALAFLRRNGFVWNRFDYWREGIKFFAARPFTGWGTGSFYLSMVSDTPESEAMNTVVLYQRTGQGHHAHNIFLTVAAENGIVGVVAMAVMVLGMARVVARSGHPMAWGLLAFAIQQMIDDSWLYCPTAFLLGLALNSVVEWQNS